MPRNDDVESFEYGKAIILDRLLVYPFIYLGIQFFKSPKTLNLARQYGEAFRDALMLPINEKTMLLISRINSERYEYPY